MTIDMLQKSLLTLAAMSCFLMAGAADAQVLTEQEEYFVKLETESYPGMKDPKNELGERALNAMQRLQRILDQYEFGYEDQDSARRALPMVHAGILQARMKLQLQPAAAMSLRSPSAVGLNRVEVLNDVLDALTETLDNFVQQTIKAHTNDLLRREEFDDAEDAHAEVISSSEELIAQGTAIREDIRTRLAKVISKHRSGWNREDDQSSREIMGSFIARLDTHRDLLYSTFGLTPDFDESRAALESREETKRVFLWDKTVTKYPSLEDQFENYEDIVTAWALTIETVADTIIAIRREVGSDLLYDNEAFMAFDQAYLDFAHAFTDNPTDYSAQLESLLDAVDSARAEMDRAVISFNTEKAELAETDRP